MAVLTKSSLPARRHTDAAMAAPSALVGVLGGTVPTATAAAIVRQELGSSAISASSAFVLAAPAFVQLACVFFSDVLPLSKV